MFLPLSQRLLVMCSLAISGASSFADIATLSPEKDNTLFESTTVALSNGTGSYFFAGQTNHSIDGIRRALLAFDIAGSVPAGAVINSVQLRMHMSRTYFVSGPHPVGLHRVQADWGEGMSDALNEEGGGIAAEIGDATWQHRFYPGQEWTADGGDFEPIARATQTVNDLGSYTWGSTSRMVEDVQAWLDNSDENFGWLVRGNEGVLASAKRFDSRENPIAADRPLLTIDYTVSSTSCESCPGDLTSDFVVNADDIAAFVTCLAAGDPNAPDCGCADLDADTNFSEEDITLLVTGLLENTLNCPQP